MKVLIPTADYAPIEGGIATVTFQVAREMAARGHEVTVVAPYFPGARDLDTCEPFRVVRYRGYRLGPARLLPMLVAAWPYLRKTDLVLAINIAAGGVIGRLGKMVYGRPYVTFAYAYEFLKFQRRPVPRGLLRRLYAASVAVVAISTFTRDQLVAFGVAAAHIRVILPGAAGNGNYGRDEKNGRNEYVVPALAGPEPPKGGTTYPCTPQGQSSLDAEDVASVRYRLVLDETAHIILAVGRFMPRKGHLTLVQAMPRVLERFPDAQLVLVGQGPAMSQVLDASHRLGVRDHVTCPGRLSDAEVAALYQMCELFALPTGEAPGGQVEGFGLVFAEAHAYGKPVVAGRSGGVVDAVIDGETGLLVPPEDPDALADAILRIMDDPELARRLGENGKRRVETELNWGHFTEQVLELVSGAPYESH